MSVLPIRCCSTSSKIQMWRELLLVLKLSGAPSIMSHAQNSTGIVYLSVLASSNSCPFSAMSAKMSIIHLRLSLVMAIKCIYVGLATINANICAHYVHMVVKHKNHNTATDEGCLNERV